MLPGPTLVIACPGCQTEHVLPTLESGNTLGARYWTDGYWEAPMLPRQPPITRCEKCEQFFWCEDAEERRQLDWLEAYTGENASVSPVRWLTLAEYEAALEAGLANTAAHHKALRTLAWWSANAPLRKKKRAAWPRSRVGRIRDNIQQLQLLFHLTNRKESLWAAEAARELGRFDEARELLRARSRDVSPMDVTASLIDSLAAEKDDRVREVRG